MVEKFHPLRCPFTGTITPRTLPLSSAPWIPNLVNVLSRACAWLNVPDFQQSLTFDLPGLHDRVGMHSYNTLSVGIFRSTFPIVEGSCSTTKKEILVDPQQLVIPKLVFVQNVGSEELGSNTSSQVFNGLTTCSLAQSHSR